MAAGDFHIFDEFLEDVGLAIHQLETATIRLALVTNATVPAENTADPRWGAGGSTNFSSTEVTPGGNYTTGGIDVTATYSEASGTATFDGTTNPQWLQNGSNPTDARWAILYNDTSAGKECIGYGDLGATIDMSAGDLTWTWGANIFTVTSTAGT